MPYVSPLNQLQIGKETVWGTAVAATAKMGLIEDAKLTPEIEVGRSPDVRGSLVGDDYVHTLDHHKASASVNGILTYEDIGYWLDSLLGLSTPSGGPNYVYARDAPIGTVPTRRMMTLIYGQTGAVSKMAGGIVTEMTISMEKNKPWKFSANLIGKSVSAGSLAVLSDRTQTPIHANHTSLFIDAVGGTIGTNQVTNPAWFSAELNIKNNADLVQGIGSLNPVAYRDAAYEASLKLSMEVHSETAAYLTSILGISLLQHQIRIKGTTGASAIVQLDFAGSHTKAPDLYPDSDGIVTFEFELTKNYNNALGNWLKTSVTNTISALP